MVIRRKYEWGNYGESVYMKEDYGEKYEGLRGRGGRRQEQFRVVQEGKFIDAKWYVRALLGQEGVELIFRLRIESAGQLQ